MRKLTLVAIASSMLLCTSCIKDELPGIDADIEEVVFENTDGVLNVTYRHSEIDIYIDESRIDPSDMTLSAIISDGASITPSPAAIKDYTTPVTYTVTSEDGKWSNDWVITVISNDLPTYYDFENWYQPYGKKYMMPFENIGSEEQPMQLNIWACGNEAYAYVAGKHDYTAYPTQPSTEEEAYSGKHALKLVTRSTGDLYKPIAAGNAFIGEFDASDYEPRNGTHFGLPFRKRPLKFAGHFNYIPGGSTHITGEPDNCRLQAVLYTTDEQTKYLTGMTIADSPNVVARAEISSAGTEGYQRFEVDFVYTSEIDTELLKSGGYNLAIVMTASRNGDIFDGAVGSTLYVDNLQIVCDENL